MTSWIKSNFGVQRFSATWHQLSFLKSHLTLHLSFPTCKLRFMWFSLNLKYPFFSPLPSPFSRRGLNGEPSALQLPSCSLPCPPTEGQRRQWSEFSTPYPVLCRGHLHTFRSPTENIKRGKTAQRSIPRDCPRLLRPHPWCALSKLGVILSSPVLNVKDSFCLGQQFSHLFQKAPISKRIFWWSIYKCRASLAEMGECFGN